MANRKVLINRHTSGSSAPNAAEMYKGEIAVAHETGKETLFTKNNAGNMVPFISCAQTITMINNAISDADVTYDVKAADGDAHVEVVSGGTEKAKVFTVSSKDVQSKAAFETYSAATDATIKNNYNTLSGAIDDVLEMLITAVTGEGIIEVEPERSGATGYNIKHKQAKKVALGFNKVATDDYGHVIDYSAVTADDINAVINVAELSAATKALSAGTIQLSADTIAYVDEQIDEVYASAVSYTDAAINALDSSISASSAGKYFTALAIENGKLVAKEEASIPVLEVESAGTGNVVASIAVADHKITYQTASVATSEGVAALSASVINLSAVTGEFSGATDSRINDLSGYTKDVDDKVKALSAGTISISGFAHGEIAELSGAVQANKSDIDDLSGATIAEFSSAFTAIQAMDKEASAVAGQVVTTVSEADGVVSETKANVKDLQLGGYVKDTAATGDIASTDTINAALSKLENKAAAITIANADKSINVTTGTTGTDINVNIKSGEKVLAKDGAAGLYTDIDLVKITTGLPATVKERYQLLATDDSQIGVNIDVPKDSHIVSINFISDPADAHYQNLEYKYIDTEGTEQTTYVDVSSLVLEAEFASGVTVTDHIAHGVVDPASEDFLTVGGAGFKLSGVQDAIDAKVNALDVTDDAAVAGQYVAAIEQTDGVVAVKTRANVSEAVLNNYAKGTDGSAVAATDSVREAIGKLENQIDNAKAAATTKVVEGTDAGNNMTIASATSETDGSVTYTVNLTDVASKAALDAEIAARKAVDGQNGDTYAANSNANYISEATSLNDADVKLDAAIKAEETARIAAIEALDSETAVTEGNYITGIAIKDGKISGITQTALPANVAISATTGAAVDTPSAVLTGVTANGTDNHNLTFGMSNKVFSASTSDSAQTSVSANMAYELSSAATISSGQVRDLENVIKNIKVNSATTAESADTAASADKVANALSVSGYSTSSASSLDSAFAFDGSEAQSLTFGTNGNAGLKSMSMTSAGVVDVEVIDCGEY